MAIKTLIYSALSLGVVGGATIGGYFVFKSEKTKQESNTKAPEKTTLQGSSTDTVAPKRGADGNPDTNREGGGQPVGQRPEGAQNSLASGSSGVHNTNPDPGTQAPSVVASSPGRV